MDVVIHGAAKRREAGFVSFYAGARCMGGLCAGEKLKGIATIRLSDGRISEAESLRGSRDRQKINEDQTYLL